MLLLAKEISKLYDNPKIIMDIKCSKVFFEEVKKIDKKSKKNRASPPPNMDKNTPKKP